MKKYLLFLLLSVRAGSAFGQDTLYLRYDEDFIPTDDTVAKNLGILVREDTVWKVTVFDMASKQKLMKGYYNLPMNRQLGLFEYYHNNGKLRSRGYFHEGLREGAWKTWNESGQLTDSIFFQERPAGSGSALRI